MERPRCQHCLERARTSGRGLCHVCSSDRAVRSLYPTAPLNEPGLGLVPPKRRPRRPTRARPGTPQKVGVLAGRAARGEGLWHPLDSGGE